MLTYLTNLGERTGRNKHLCASLWVVAKKIRTKKDSHKITSKAMILVRNILRWCSEFRRLPKSDKLYQTMVGAEQGTYNVYIQHSYIKFYESASAKQLPCCSSTVILGTTFTSQRALQIMGKLGGHFFARKLENNRKHEKTCNIMQCSPNISGNPLLPEHSYNPVSPVCSFVLWGEVRWVFHRVLASCWDKPYQTPTSLVCSICASPKNALKVRGCNHELVQTLKTNQNWMANRLETAGKLFQTVDSPVNTCHAIP